MAVEYRSARYANVINYVHVLIIHRMAKHTLINFYCALLKYQSLDRLGLVELTHDYIIYELNTIGREAYVLVHCSEYFC